MKKVFFFFLFLLPVYAFSQVKFSAESIPLEDGKVVFRVVFEDLNLEKDEVQLRVSHYLKNELKTVSKQIIMNNNEKIICRAIDLLDYKSGALYSYAVYMRYNLMFEYAENTCTMTFFNINFVDKNEYDKIQEQSRTDLQSSEAGFVLYSAKDIMIDGKYKVLLVKDASGRVTKLALGKINEMIKDVEILFLRKNL